MARLPKTWNETDGDLDQNNWGTLLNEFLLVGHAADGTTNFLLVSPNGTRYRLGVSKDGALPTTIVVA